jgi:hypothetical protein
MNRNARTGRGIDVLESPPVLSLVPLKGVGSPTHE